jgi:transposase InsO family protein
VADARAQNWVILYTRVQHRFTRLYSPRTNGKAERFIRTLLERWAYATAYRSSGWRTRALPRLIAYYNHVRPQQGLHGQTPAQRRAAAL